MDIYAELKKDHRELLRLVRHILQVNQGDVPSIRKVLESELAERFDTHVLAKKRIFYPVLKSVPRYRAEAEDAEREHEETAAGLRKLQHLDPNHGAWMARFKPLAERIQRLFKREEEVLLREFRENVDAHQAMEYGHLIRRLEEQRT